MASLTHTIAKAIQKADKSYFFEDYGKQAAAVLQMLESEGYAIVPKKPTEEMVETGRDQITAGSVKPQELVTRIYTAMVKTG